MVVTDDLYSFGIEGTGAGLRTAMREWGRVLCWGVCATSSDGRLHRSGDGHRLLARLAAAISREELTLADTSLLLAQQPRPVSVLNNVR